MRNSGDLLVVNYLERKLGTTQILPVYFNNKPGLTSPLKFFKVKTHVSKGPHLIGVQRLLKPINIPSEDLMITAVTSAE